MARSAHGALSANEILTVEIEPSLDGFVVVNRSFEGVLWVRFDGSDPEPMGPGSFTVFGSRRFALTRRQVQAGVIAVKLVSDANRAFSVEAV